MTTHAYTHRICHHSTSSRTNFVPLNATFGTGSVTCVFGLWLIFALLRAGSTISTLKHSMPPLAIVHLLTEVLFGILPPAELAPRRCYSTQASLTTPHVPGAAPESRTQSISFGTARTLRLFMLVEKLMQTLLIPSIYCLLHFALDCLRAWQPTPRVHSGVNALMQPPCRFASSSVQRTRW